MHHVNEALYGIGERDINTVLASLRGPKRPRSAEGRRLAAQQALTIFRTNAAMRRRADQPVANLYSLHGTLVRQLKEEGQFPNWSDVALGIHPGEDPTPVFTEMERVSQEALQKVFGERE